LDIVLLKAVGINPVVVHGGGPQIGAMLKKLGVESRFIDGLRVTDKETAQIAEMVLCGSINKELVGWIAGAGGKAIGISGKDGGLVTAEKVERTATDQAVDLGYVGEPATVDTTIIETACAAGMIPVIAPIAAGADGATYNINADTMAGAIAAALGAKRLFLLTDVAGVLDKDKQLLTDLTPDDVARLRDDPEARDLRPCGLGGMRSGGRPRRASTARDAARILHVARRGHANPGWLRNVARLGASCRYDALYHSRRSDPCRDTASGGVRQVADAEAG
jgi:acetylglutamate kinase